MTSDSTQAFMNFLNIVSSMLKTIKIVTKTELSFKTKKQLECVLAFYATIQYVIRTQYQTLSLKVWMKCKDREIK